jgi:alpha-1,6-mannosyltransferase
MAAGFLWPLSMRRVPHVVMGYQPLASALGAGLVGAVRFVIPVALAGLVFGLAAWLARRTAGGHAIAVVLGGTFVLAATLLPINPLGAQDVYHDIADARTLWIHHENPAVHPPSEHPHDPFYPHVPVWKDYPSSYGPLWYVLSGAPLPFTGDGPWANVLGQKALAVLFLMGTTALVIALAEQLQPGSGPAAGVLVGWNPLVLFETAGNAHNDIVMVCFALAGLYCIGRRWWWGVFPAFALAIAIKYLMVLPAGLALLWMIRRPDVPRRALAVSIGAALAVGAAQFVPYLADGGAFDSIRAESARITSSPGTGLVALLMRYGGMGGDDAIALMKPVMTAVFLYAAARLALGELRRPASHASLMRSSAWLIFLLLVLAKWWFWPWYLLWFVPLAALLPGERAARVAAVFSISALLLYVTYYWQLYQPWYQLQVTTVAVVFLPPVVTLLWLNLHDARRAGVTATDDQQRRLVDAA